MSSKNRLTINISEDEQAKVAAIADKCHVSAAWIGRQALREFLEKCRHTPAGLVLPVSTEPAGKEPAARAKA